MIGAVTLSWQEGVTLLDISIDCSYYSASLLKKKKRMRRATPLTLLLFPSSSSVVTAGHRGDRDAKAPADWLSHFWHRATSRVRFVFLRMCQLQRGEEEGAWGDWRGGDGGGSFSLTNTVTHLPVK